MPGLHLPSDAHLRLDHGFIRLIDIMGSDLSVVRAARVSYNAAWRAGEDEGSDTKLINYLWRNMHTTPFEACTMTIEIKAPIFVFRQWHRHRTQSYNEMSARYCELPEEFYLPMASMIGKQDPKNKQGRTFDLTDAELRDRRSEIEGLRITCEEAFATYRSLLRKGWPRELARSCLPVNTYSHQFVTLNLLNCFRFLTLRNDLHAQYEIRTYAEAWADLLQPHFPVCMGAFRRYKWKMIEVSDAA